APNPDLDEVETAQPLLLLLGYALGRALTTAGRAPDILLGHSAGELAAACLAGVYPPAALARLVIARSHGRPDDGPGGGLGGAAAGGELGVGWGGGGVVAAVNGPRQRVLAGPPAGLALVADRLRTAGFTVRALRSRHAFHSPAMAPVARRFGRALGGLPATAPHTTVQSSRTAGAVRPEQAADPRV